MTMLQCSGMWAHALTVSDYQDLIDRGWRRSGKYCYKPTMDVTCCPMYTIRCRSQVFKATKSQKKVLKRFNKFLLGQDKQNAYNVERKMSTCSNDSETIDERFVESNETFLHNTKQHDNIDINNIKYIDSDEGHRGDSLKGDTSLPVNMTNQFENKGQHSKIKEVGADPTKAPCKKAKQIRLERRMKKLKEKGIDITSLNTKNKNKEKELEHFINELPDDVKHKLEIKLVRTAPPSPEWLASAKETHDVYVKYQTTIHNDELSKCTEQKFKDFLVKSPLLEEHTETGPPSGFGSFHQQYWLDGKLIAVGVIDILPKCVSSVYFFYDPQYVNLTLGTYGALREIEFTRNLHNFCPSIKYYYMGYYIHSCPKMRYKGNFFPSDLLCPETYKWFSLKECIPKLEASPYSRLDPNIDSIDENYPQDSDINYIPVWVDGTVMLYKVFKRKVDVTQRDSSDDVITYARLVGTKASRNLILVR